MLHLIQGNSGIINSSLPCHCSRCGFPVLIGTFLQHIVQSFKFLALSIDLLNKILCNGFILRHLRSVLCPFRCSLLHCRIKILGLLNYLLNCLSIFFFTFYADFRADLCSHIYLMPKMIDSMLCLRFGFMLPEYIAMQASISDISPVVVHRISSFDIPNFLP